MVVRHASQLRVQTKQGMKQGSQENSKESDSSIAGYPQETVTGRRVTWAT